MPTAPFAPAGGHSNNRVRASLIVIAVAFLFLGGLFTILGGRPLVDAWRYRDAIHAEAIATATGKPMTRQSSVVRPATIKLFQKMPRYNGSRPRA